MASLILTLSRVYSANGPAVARGGLLLTGFIVFTALYILLSIALIYHLKEYSLSGSRAPKIVTAIFLSLSVILWLIAVFLLFQISDVPTS